MPRYAHVFVIIEENHTTDEIVPSEAPANLTGFAQHYGYSWRFYAEAHPSEPNYVAMLGGDTFGIRDDDAFWCRPKVKDPACPNAGKAGYVDHTVSATSLVSQLAAQHLTWKGYFEDIPAPGSRAWLWPADAHAVAGKPAGLYAAKHNGFMNFKEVQDDPALAQKIVGFRRAGTRSCLRQCPELSRRSSQTNATKCTACPGQMFQPIATSVRSETHRPRRCGCSEARCGNHEVAVLAGPEQRHRHHLRRERHQPCRRSCRGLLGNPKDPDNPGGGWIPTIVITNHGPRGLTELTPFNHYSCCAHRGRLRDQGTSAPRRRRRSPRASHDGAVLSARQSVTSCRRAGFARGDQSETVMLRQQRAEARNFARREPITGILSDGVTGRSRKGPGRSRPSD